jgi:hypothetical protein
MSLYAIKSEMLSLMEAFGEHGAGSAEAEAAIREHAAALSEQFDAKADDYAALIRVCETRAEARRGEAERMIALASVDEALASRLRETLLKAMSETGRTKVQTSRFSMAVKRNGGVIPLRIVDDAAIPVEFRVPKVTTVLDRDGIRRALESGAAVPGAELGERGFRLDLK